MIALLFALVGAVANRASGMKEWFPGRNIYGVALILAVLAGIFYGPVFGLVLGLSALTYRIPGWYGALDIGRNEGNPFLDFGIMCLRGFMVFPIFWFTGGMIFLLPLALMHGLAYAISVWLVWEKAPNRDPIAVAEILAGASIGLWLAVAIGYA